MSPDPTPITASAPAAPSPLALRLGHAGLVPFVAGALAVWGAPEPWRPGAASALLAYAAVIASFLGGMHWGMALRAPANAGRLWWGIAASLAGWAGLLLPPAPGLLLCAALLLACYAVDHRLYPAAGAADWLPLRLRLSAVASLCCFLAAWAA